MKFIIGIGNPGKKYEKTRHNIGFGVLDLLNKRDSIEGLQLVKPATFVNRTGDEVLKILKNHNLKTQDVLLVCDDVNLDFGKIRIRRSGSAGGHHGLESVILSLGSDDVPRLRVGVRNDSMPSDLTSFVLEGFNSTERSLIPEILKKAVLVCERWAKEDFESAQKELSRLQSLKEKE